MLNNTLGGATGVHIVLMVIALTMYCDFGSRSKNLGLCKRNHVLIYSGTIPPSILNRIAGFFFRSGLRNGFVAGKRPNYIDRSKYSLALQK